MKVKVSSDSSCDLSPELIQQYGLTIIPGYIGKGDTYLKDMEEITPDEIYAYTKATGKLCKTSATSEDDYTAYFTKALESCDAIVHFHISSDMSASYQNACIAAKKFEGRVFPYDSRNLSTGIGHLVLDSAIRAGQGMSAKEIVEACDAERDKLNVSFLISTLQYLYKGGRCSAVAALGANILGLKPCIEVKGGVMGVGKKYRGAIGKALLNYVDDRLKDRDDIDLRRIFITHSGGLKDEDIEAVRKEVAACQPFKEIHITRAAGTVACHCGPGTLGILYYDK